MEKQTLPKLPNLNDEDILKSIKEKLDEKNKALFDLDKVSKSLEVTNEKLIVSEKVKSDFLSNIRNEINNPLTSLLGISKEMALGDIKDLVKLKNLASMLYYESLSLDFQIRNILMAAEIESGESELRVSKIFLDGILKDVLEDLKPFADGKKVTIEINKDIYEHTLNSDNEKLYVCLLNLIHNAIEFNKENGRVFIDGNFQDDDFVFSIKDEGIGIEKKNEKNIFDRFFQAEKGSEKTYRGHGLGLSIVKALSEHLYGDVSFESMDNKGTVFTLKIKNVNDDETHLVTESGVEFFTDINEGDEGEEF